MSENTLARRVGRIAAAAAIAGGLVFAGTGAAFADTDPLPLGNSVTGSGACTPVMDGLSDHWEMYHKGKPATDIVSETEADPTGYADAHVDMAEQMACMG